MQKFKDSMNYQWAAWTVIDRVISCIQIKFNPDIVEYYGEFDKPRNILWKFVYHDILPIYQTIRKRALALRKNSA